MIIHVHVPVIIPAMVNYRYKKHINNGLRQLDIIYTDIYDHMFSYTFR